MFIEEMNDFFGNETSVGGKGVIGFFVELFVFIF